MKQYAAKAVSFVLPRQENDIFFSDTGAPALVAVFLVCHRL